MIPRQELVDMFDHMTANTNWNIAAPMVWGYFFTHDTPEPLNQAAAMLQQEGYELVGVYASEPKDPEEPLWWLHVERIETHDVDSLFARNEQLSEFAARYGFCYDGMDVGPVKQERLSS
jgi:hypothetical protein